MPKDPKQPAEPTIEALIAQGVRLKENIKTQEERLKVIAAKLTNALPAGAHEGDEGTKISIIEPTGQIKLAAKDLAAVKEIAGTRFSKLFKLSTGYKAVKGFREILAAVFEKGEQKKVLALVESDAAKYVKWD